MNFDGQVVVVSGASRGIGRAIAMAYGAAGAHVVCVATTVEGAARTSDAIVAAGGKASAQACNVSETESVEALWNSLDEAGHTATVLVNNAGITADTLMLRMKDDDWDRVLDVNLKGAFLMIRAASKRLMKARYGRIINITSVVGLHGAAGQTNYSASKAGLVGLTMSVAKELGSRGITCNAVAPGFIDSDMTEKLPEEFKEHVVKTAPAGRLGTGDDIAQAVLFLSSKEASYITGQTLTVDGGLML